MPPAKFRTPTRCQNGHFRWLYSEFSRGEVKSTWGDKDPECKCPTGEIGQGFAPIGDSQQFTGQRYLGNVYAEGNNDGRSTTKAQSRTTARQQVDEASDG